MFFKGNHSIKIGNLKFQIFAPKLLSLSLTTLHLKVILVSYFTYISN